MVVADKAKVNIRINGQWIPATAAPQALFS
jgi:hypothetical protein